MPQKLQSSRSDDLAGSAATKSPPAGDVLVAEAEIDVKGFISTLPAREGWTEPLIQYKGYWFRPMMAERVQLLQLAFRPRADDIILATQPKCGTTWLKALAFAITTHSRHTFSDHPLLTGHPQHIVPSIEFPGVGMDHTHIEALPSPRLLATHIPLSLLPPGTSSCGCRVVYLCRDPKDALVSRLHFENKLLDGFSLSMDDAFSMFSEGFSSFGPFWDHCLEYWNESVARPDNVLFLKYEELKSDPVRVVRKLAKFLNAPFTDEEESAGVVQEVVKLCSFEMLTSLKVNQIGAAVSGGKKLNFSNSVYYRKGQVGDWVNHMSQEMAQELDSIVQQKLQGSGLAF